MITLEEKRVWLQGNYVKILGLYPDLTKIYGPYSSKDGRIRVLLYSGKNKTTRQFSKLLMEVYLGRKLNPITETVDHIDDDYQNDRLANLSVITLRQNASKAHATGVSSSSYLVNYTRCDEGRLKSREKIKGELNPRSKFSDIQVIEYRKNFSEGKITLEEIAKINDIGLRSVKAMLRGITYGHLGNKLNLNVKGR